MDVAIGRICVVAAFCGLVVGGCATTPYRYAGDYHTERDAPLKPQETQSERGRRAPILDGVGWLVGVPGKILLLDSRVANHQVSPATEACLLEYLAKNDLGKVKVRINEYDPADQWRRLKANESMIGPVRYTFGAISVIGYTLLPGRIWGGDGYDPYTNTINIYSDVPAIALYEGGCAKQQAMSKYKGFSAIFGGGPINSIRASNDALGYIKENGDAADMRGGYRSMYPMVAMSAVSPIVRWFAPPVIVPVLVAGHAAGQAKAVAVNDADFPGKSLLDDSRRQEVFSGGIASRALNDAESNGAVQPINFADVAGAKAMEPSVDVSGQGQEIAPTSFSTDVMRLPPVVP